MNKSEENTSAQKTHVHPMTSRLRGPRHLSLQILPGLAAEAELTLKHLAKRPQACFEQQIARLDARLISLESNPNNESSAFQLKNRSELKKSLANLWTYQTSSGAFAAHPKLPEDPWLTSLALDFLTRMEGQG
ncbi:MAG: hypothetical protein P1V97_05000, partial [Planctomycetota bacterium]|nr:hypothetical protein [Planctomycetota bacterium]